MMKNDNRTRSYITVFTFAILAVFLLPLAYGVSMSLKTKEQIASLNPSPLPRTPKTFEYEGNMCDVFTVSFEDGSTRDLAIVSRGRAESVFVDPGNPAAGKIVWVGQWRTLEPVWTLAPQWRNFKKAWQSLKFLTLLKNTALYALVTTFGTVLSSLFVAYGFARFNFRGKKVLFIVLIATIILPPAVTLIPTYSMFYRLGWVGTWLPLMVPSFFANAYNVFLLRQFIMGIPREMDEAARIDGAGPILTLFLVIMPQAVPAIISVSLFHFFFAWNDFFGPLIYLAGKPELQPITIGLSTFNNMYTTETHLVQAASLISCVIPFIIFFVAQKFFMQGVVVTGVDK
jgi:multiple sugar transport system permease protein